MRRPWRGRGTRTPSCSHRCSCCRRPPPPRAARSRRDRCGSWLAGADRTSWRWPHRVRPGPDGREARAAIALFGRRRRGRSSIAGRGSHADRCPAFGAARCRTVRFQHRPTTTADLSRAAAVLPGTRIARGARGLGSARLEGYQSADKLEARRCRAAISARPPPRSHARPRSTRERTARIRHRPRSADEGRGRARQERAGGPPRPVFRGAHGIASVAPIRALIPFWTSPPEATRAARAIPVPGGTAVLAAPPGRSAVRSRDRHGPLRAVFAPPGREREPAPGSLGAGADPVPNRPSGSARASGGGSGHPRSASGRMSAGSTRARAGTRANRGSRSPRRLASARPIRALIGRRASVPPLAPSRHPRPAARGP